MFSCTVLTALHLGVLLFSVAVIEGVANTPGNAPSGRPIALTPNYRTETDILNAGVVRPSEALRLFNSPVVSTIPENRLFDVATRSMIYATSPAEIPPVIAALIGFSRTRTIATKNSADVQYIGSLFTEFIKSVDTAFRRTNAGQVQVDSMYDLVDEVVKRMDRMMRAAALSAGKGFQVEQLLQSNVSLPKEREAMPLCTNYRDTVQGLTGENFAMQTIINAFRTLSTSSIYPLLNANPNGGTVQRDTFALSFIKEAGTINGITLPAVPEYTASYGVASTLNNSFTTAFTKSACWAADKLVACPTCDNFVVYHHVAPVQLGPTSNGWIPLGRDNRFIPGPTVGVPFQELRKATTTYLCTMLRDDGTWDRTVVRGDYINGACQSESVGLVGVFNIGTPQHPSYQRRGLKKSTSTLGLALGLGVGAPFLLLVYAGAMQLMARSTNRKQAGEVYFTEKYDPVLAH